MTTATINHKEDPTKQKSEAAPVSACMFESTLFGDLAESKFAESDSEYSEGDPYPVRLLARTVEPVGHWYWYGGKVYHDLKGMKMHRKRIVIDYKHDIEVGWLEDKTIDKQGLWLAGQIVPTGSLSDPAGDIIKRGRGGVPYEASIFFDHPMVIEYIDEGKTGKVNGKKVEGPCTIVRECELRAVAVCPHGKDGNTETQFSSDGADDQLVKFSIQGSENTPPGGEAAAMSKDTPQANDPTKQGSKPASGEANDKIGEASNKQSAGDESKDSESASEPGDSASKQSEGNASQESARDDVRAEVKRFTDRFGPERGLGYFNDGLSFAAALDKDHKRLSESNEQLQQKLSGKNATDELGEGETSTGEFTSDSEPRDRKSRFRFAGQSKAS